MMQLYIGAAVVVAVFSGGWTARDWYQSTIEMEKVELIEEFRAEQSNVARIVEEKLKGLRANERIIERWKTEIVDRPVYHTDCIDSDGVRLIESYATGRAAELTSEMPGKLAKPDGD